MKYLLFDFLKYPKDLNTKSKQQKKICHLQNHPQ